MSTISFLASVGDVGGAERFRRQREAGQDVDLVAHHQFLRQALGDVRVRAAGVLADDFDFLAGDGVAVLLHVQLDAVVDLRRGVGELAGIGADDADLDGVLRAGGVWQSGRREQLRQQAIIDDSWSILPCDSLDVVSLADRMPDLCRRRKAPSLRD